MFQFSGQDLFCHVCWRSKLLWLAKLNIKVECYRDEHFALKARRVNPKNFFAELKRRNVYKVAIAYGVIAENGRR
jgi:hypothetical protein